MRLEYGGYTYEKYVSINGGTFNAVGTTGTSGSNATTEWRTFAVPDAKQHCCPLLLIRRWLGRGFANAIRIDGTILIDDANQIDVNLIEICTSTKTSSC